MKNLVRYNFHLIKIFIRLTDVFFAKDFFVSILQIFCFDCSEIQSLAVWNLLEAKKQTGSDRWQNSPDSFTQSYTERVVKTVRETESRFAGYDEADESEGTSDRAKQEI